jgi:serine/threonine-protein kinase
MRTTPSLRELFETALELAPADREKFLSTRCPDDDLRAQLHRMLAADAQAKATLARDASELAGALIQPSPPPALSPGSRVGPFTVQDIIGRGGYSTVFRAERTQDGVRQEIALKVLDRLLFSDEAQRQFRRERQALANLRHPGIARLIEGGIAETGLAYIAMELVDGAPITEHARVVRLDLRARLKLFVEACRAVEAAHRALIVHRDLKPGNVFVAKTGEVKLLDFGVAKMLDLEDDTQTHLPAFTPAYAAPEQRDGRPITTATDVYALGVLLGELITGERLSGESGRTPSGHISENHEPGVLPASAPVTRRLVRGDLDNIVMKAIDVDPDRRYASAGALADDIDRLLEGMPVLAHPPSTWYRTRKFVSRHRGGVLTTAAFLLAVFAALGIALWQAHVARREASRADAVRDFVVQLFDAAKTDLPSNEKPTPAALVDEAVKRVRADGTLDPSLRADFLLTLGTVTRIMGDFPRAEALLDESARQQDALGLGADAQPRLDLAVQLASLYQATDRNTRADRVLADALPTLRASNTPAAVEGLMLYAYTRMFAGHGDESMAFAEEAVAKARKIYAANSIDLIKVRSVPGQLCVALRRDADCTARLEPVVAEWRASGAPLDMDFAQAIGALATDKQGHGDMAGAEALYRENIALRRSIFGARPNDRLSSELETFALWLTKQERFDEARALLLEARSIATAVFGPNNTSVASILYSLGTLDGAQRQFPAAETDLRESLAMYQAHLKEAGQAENDLHYTRVWLARVLRERGAFDEAKKILDDDVAEVGQRGGDENPVMAMTLAERARLALARSDIAEARRDMDHALSISKKTNQSGSARVTLAATSARVLIAEERHTEAVTELDTALDRLSTYTPGARSLQASLLAQRAREQLALGRNTDAEKSIAQARALNVPTTLLSPEDDRTINH